MIRPVRRVNGPHKLKRISKHTTKNPVKTIYDILEPRRLEKNRTDLEV